MRTANAFGNPLGAAIGLGAAALAFAAAAAEKPRPAARPAPAPAAERYSAPTSYRTPTPGHGYSAQSRHMADCLATYRSYNPDTDRIVVRPGVTRRCEF
jgi:hypothetical protein